MPFSNTHRLPPERGSGETVFSLTFFWFFLILKVSLRLITYWFPGAGFQASANCSGRLRPARAEESARHSIVRFRDLSRIAETKLLKSLTPTSSSMFFFRKKSIREADDAREEP